MQQQPPSPMLNSTPPRPFPSNSITTDEIQKYLDDNRNLILAIMENQNLGKLAECSQLQALLQKNLMYLAAIADAQPPPPSGPSQVPSNSVPPQGNYMQQPQGTMFQQQQGGGVPKLPFQLNSLRPQDQQQHLINFQQQQQMQQMQQMHGQVGLRPGPNNGMHGMHQAQQHMGIAGGLMDTRGNRQDGSDAASGDGQTKSSAARGGNRES